MNNTTDHNRAGAPLRVSTAKIRAGLKARHRANSRLRYYGLGAIVLALGFLSLLFISIISKGYSAFVQTQIKLDIEFSAAEIDPSEPARADYQGLVKSALRELWRLRADSKKA